MRIIFEMPYSNRVHFEIIFDDKMHVYAVKKCYRLLFDFYIKFTSKNILFNDQIDSIATNILTQNLGDRLLKERIKNTIQFTLN